MVLDKKEGTAKRKSKKILAGYDLGDLYAQISYCSMDGEEPETLAMVTGTEQYNIPMVLCKRNEVNQWFYGKEAIKYAQSGEGIRVDNLVALARSGELVDVGGEEFDPVALLILFIKRSLSLLGMVASPDCLEGIIFTVDYLDKQMVQVLSQIAANLNLKTNQIYFQSHMESFYYFVLNQPKELWNYQVMLCDYDNSRMKIYLLDSNKNTTPVVLYIETDEYTDMARPESTDETIYQEDMYRELDSRFLEIVKEKSKEKTISCVYLIGDGYRDEWAKESLHFLCMGRRVFKGNNLYSKGACYSIKERMGIGEAGKGYVFLGQDKLKSNIGMKVIRKGIDSYFAIMDAGINWFEAKKEYDVILEDGDSITTIVVPLNGREPRAVNMVLDGLPQRPKRATRLHIMMEMISDSQISIKVKDMGFGELFPPSEGEWIKVIEI